MDDMIKCTCGGIPELIPSEWYEGIYKAQCPECDKETHYYDAEDTIKEWNNLIKEELKSNERI